MFVYFIYVFCSFEDVEGKIEKKERKVIVCVFFVLRKVIEGVLFRLVDLCFSVVFLDVVLVS